MPVSGQPTGSDHLLDGSHQLDYQQSFSRLQNFIDRTLDDYKEELQQVLFPVFTVLYLTMINRGFEQAASDFFSENSPLFSRKNQEMTVLEKIKTRSDLTTTLEADRYLQNKQQVKLSEEAKEILLQFFKFDNLILLMQVANHNMDFKITTERNIIDLKTTISAIISGQKPQGSILIPYEQNQENLNFQQQSEDLIMGRLPEFCPEANEKPQPPS